MTAREFFDLTGKTAIVTGGGSGIGLQMAYALAEVGANIVLCARNADRCAAIAATLADDTSVRTLGMRCDVTNPDEVEGMVARTIDEFGAVDILVNNSGTSWGAPAEEYPLEGWQKVVDVNLTGTFLCSQATGRHMLERGAGKIINIASVAGLLGAPTHIRRAVAYSSSKGGVLSMTRDLACQWGRRGITVNAIAPGWFASAMADKVLGHVHEEIVEGIPLGRVGGETDLKGTIVFLAAPASDYITGHTIIVDGGKSIW
jgi:NAD(P)-dependent dehydrogenase (short-subunit alcohol dehydrogenase family)